MARAQATTDHSVIRRWIEAHNGHPSIVRATKGSKQGSAGLLRVDFEEAEESLEEVSWDDFFDTFDENGLAFLYQDEKDSRFFKFVSRDSVDSDESATESSTRRSTKSASTSGNGGKIRQASPAEEDEAEEIDEEDVEDDEDLEDEEDEDEDENPSRGKKR